MKTATKKLASIKTAPAAEPAEPVKPVLGVDVKGELQDILISTILEPKGTPDRLERDGDEEATEQLARSMSEVGQLQPIMVERLADGRHRRVFGRRRLAAAIGLGWKSIRASVVAELPDDVRRTIVAVENVQRRNLTPAEETLAVDELVRLQALNAAVQLNQPLRVQGGLDGQRVTHEVLEKLSRDQRAAWSSDVLLDPRVVRLATELVAAMLGQTPQWVRDRMYIGRLSPAAKQLVLDGKLPLAHAREIAKVSDEDRRDALAKAYAAGGSDSISDVEPGQLADLQDEVRKSVFSLHVVPWKLESAFAGCEACTGCRYNSASMPGLFEGGGGVSLEMRGGEGTMHAAAALAPKVVAAGVCTKPSCYAIKLRAAKAAASSAAKRIVDAGKKSKDVQLPAQQFLKPAAIEEKVEARKKLGSKKAKSGNTMQSEVLEKAQRMQKAKNEHAAAVRTWVRTLHDPIDKALAKQPGGRLAAQLLLSSSLFGKLPHDAEKARKKLAGPAYAQALASLAAAPTLERLIALYEDSDYAGRQLVNEWDDGPSGLAAAVAKALGIDVGAEPKLEDFLKPEPEKTAKPAKKPSNKE